MGIRVKVKVSEQESLCLIRIALVKKELSVNQVGRYSGIANIKFLMCIYLYTYRTFPYHNTLGHLCLRSSASSRCFELVGTPGEFPRKIRSQDSARKLNYPYLSKFVNNN